MSRTCSHVAGVIQPAQPAHAQEAVEDVPPLRREKGRDMHAVRDVVDRVFFGGDLRPEMSFSMREVTPPCMRETPL